MFSPRLGAAGGHCCRQRYTFTPREAWWWFDDQKLAVSDGEKARKWALKNHRLPQGQPVRPVICPLRAPGGTHAVCDEFTELILSIDYHSAGALQHELGGLKGLQAARKEPIREVGSTFAATVTNRPLECAQ